MPNSHEKKSLAKGPDASKSNAKAGTPAPYEFSGRGTINISSFDLAQVQESLEHSDVPSMRPQLKSPRQCPRELNHPMHWQLSQHEFLIARHKALRSSGKTSLELFATIVDTSSAFSSAHVTCSRTSFKNSRNPSPRWINRRFMLLVARRKLDDLYKTSTPRNPRIPS
jgi:hypothetical protein